VTDDSTLLGRRERKKLATRHALSSAALQLAVERGLENVTIEDITARADVSLRTFRNYFASKYEAICAIAADRARHIGASLLERPASGPLWDAIVNAVLQHYQEARQALDLAPVQNNHSVTERAAAAATAVRSIGYFSTARELGGMQSVT